MEVTPGHRIIKYSQLRQIKDICIMIRFTAGQNLKSWWNGPKLPERTTVNNNTQFPVQQVVYAKNTSWS